LQDFQAVSYGNGQFVAVDGGGILTSADRTNWVIRLYDSSAQLSAITYGDDRFMAVGLRGAILESGSIITLALTRNPGAGSLTLSSSGPTGLDYTLQSSTNLVSWQTVTNFTSARSTTVIFDNLPAASGRLFYRAFSQ